MYAERKTPALIAAFVAIVGTAVILVNDFKSYGSPQVLARANMITSAAVSRAGAIETPTDTEF